MDEPADPPRPHPTSPDRRGSAPRGSDPARAGGPGGPLLSISVAVVLAAAVTWAAADGGARVGAVPVVAICAAVAFGLNWAVFVPSLLARTERYYDLTGSITYLTVVALALVLAPSGPTAVLLGVLVALWAARLGSVLFARIRLATVPTVVSARSSVTRCASRSPGRSRACGWSSLRALRSLR